MPRPAQVIKRLRRKIPTFDCIPGCTDCCGPPIFSRWELKQVDEDAEDTFLSDALEGLKAHKQGCLNCPYSLNGGCDIYEDRPIICRLFGAVDTPRLRCPHGRQPTVMLTEQDGYDIMREYMAVMAR